jgi:hypothetical protein
VSASELVSALESASVPESELALALESVSELVLELVSESVSGPESVSVLE